MLLAGIYGEVAELLGKVQGFQSSEMEIFLSRLRQEARFLTRTLARKSVYLQHYMPTPQMWSGLCTLK
jgi:hypothetical protein